MKSSTKVKISGVTIFIVSSLIIQQYIDSMLYIGIVFMWLSWMLMGAQIDLERSEKSFDEMRELRNEIEESLKKLRDAKEEKHEPVVDDNEYFDKKRSEH